MAKTWTKGGITFKRDKSGKVTRVLPTKKEADQKKKSRARAEAIADVDLSKFGSTPGTSVHYDPRTGVATYKKDGEVVAQQQAKGLRVGRGSAVPTGRDVIVPTKSGGTRVIREGDLPVERTTITPDVQTISQVAIPRGTRRTVVPTAKELAMAEVTPQSKPSRSQLIDGEIQPAQSMKPTYQDFPEVASEKLTKEISKVESREREFDIQKEKDPTVLFSEFGSREAAGLERVSLFAQKVGLKAARSATDLFSTVWNIQKTDIAIAGAVSQPFATGYAFGESVLQVEPSDVLAEGLFDVATAGVLSKASKLKYLDDLPFSTRRMTLDVDKDLFKSRVKSGEFALKGDVSFEIKSTQLPIIEEATGQVTGFQTQLIGKEVTPELDLTKLDVPGMKPLDTAKQTTLSDVRVTYDQPQVTRFETGSQTEFVGDMFLGRTTPKGEKVITDLPLSKKRVIIGDPTELPSSSRIKLFRGSKKGQASFGTLQKPDISFDDFFGSSKSKLEGFDVRQAKEIITRPSFKSITTDSFKVSILPPVSLLKPSERLAVTNLTKVKARTSPKSIISTIQRPDIMIDTLPAIKVKPVQAQKPSQVQTPDVFQITRSSYRQTPVIDTTFKVEEVIKRDKRISTPTPRVLPSIDLKKKPKKKKGLFDVFVRRKGVFSKIGEVSGASQAIALGKQRVGQTLAASFKVVEKGTGKAVSPVDIGRSFRASKREAGVIVQRRSARLSAGRERSEIKQAKKSKRMRL